MDFDISINIFSVLMHIWYKNRWRAMFTNYQKVDSIAKWIWILKIIIKKNMSKF